jgi:hypothetical protein
LINADVSAETLKAVLRHEDFKTTERFYGAVRVAQSAAAEVHQKLANAGKESESVRETERAPRPRIRPKTRRRSLGWA